MNKKKQAIEIIFLFTISTMTSTVFGSNISLSTEASLVEDCFFDVYDVSTPIDYKYDLEKIISSKEFVPFKTELEQSPIIRITDDPMDSPWLMYCRGARHTGRSSYNTIDNPGFEKWWFKCNGFIEGSGAIDNNGVIYFGSWNNNFYALYPNGILKWKYDIGGNVEDTGPAIDENGIVYVGTKSTGGDHLFAFYPNGTVKWTYFTGEWIYGSPVIGNDGSIYFGTSDGYPWYGHIYALYPNGTLKWRYKINDVIYSDPAIGLDGTVYCGSHNGKLYALYPNNGTLKWKFGTDGWIGRGPCIADDGTIIFGSWDGYLYACYPNGTLKWKTGVGVVTTPVLGDDGTIYVGSDFLSAVNPDDGNIKWSYDVPGVIRSGNPCVSGDGIIYCGTMDSGFLVAVNSNGSERWRKYIGTCNFAPIIGEDGNVYVGTSQDELDEDLGGYVAAGYLRAFNELDPDAPSTPSISGPDKGKIGKEYKFSFSAISPLDNDLFYFVDWGDKSNTGWIGPYSSGRLIVLKHAFESWSGKTVYTVRVKARDEDDRWGPWGYHEFNTPRNRASFSAYWLRFFDMFPILQRFLSLVK